MKFRIPTRKLGRIVQVEITTKCDKACANCTRALAQVSKPDMTPKQFEQAVLASKDWIIRERGTLAAFGGNPCASACFDEICAIIREHLPEENRGLWTNNFLGKGKVISETFTKKGVYNFNCHQDQKAADEILEVFPWATVHGRDRASLHASIFIASQDFLNEEGIWKAVSKCTYDIEWSAIVIQEAPDWGSLGGYSCEIAATHARTNRKALGVPVEPGWLDLKEKDFEHQYDFACRRCGGCLNLDGVQDIGGNWRDQFSETNLNVLAMTKSRTRPTEVVKTLPATGSTPIDYLRLRN